MAMTFVARHAFFDGLAPRLTCVHVSEPEVEMCRRVVTGRSLWPAPSHPARSRARRIRPTERNPTQLGLTTSNLIESRQQQRKDRQGQASPPAEQQEPSSPSEAKPPSCRRNPEGRPNPNIREVLPVPPTLCPPALAAREPATRDRPRGCKHPSPVLRSGSKLSTQGHH
eukprot:363620-Chlamydomonas_euryale.AAC.16